MSKASDKAFESWWKYQERWTYRGMDPKDTENIKRWLKEVWDKRGQYEAKLRRKAKKESLFESGGER